jgi:formylglycine-generating enzyme required for sulfatase activity
MIRRGCRFTSVMAVIIGFLVAGCSSEPGSNSRKAESTKAKPKLKAGVPSVGGGMTGQPKNAPKIVPFESEGVNKGFTLDMGEGIAMEFIGIGRGSFTMGNGKNGLQPHGEVVSDPFYLGKYEVTQAQWKLVMETNPSFFPDPKNPVDRLQWADCQAFLQKMNEKYGKPGRRFILPTEIQWEYACRGGYNMTFGSGIDLETAAWYSANAKNKTHPVGEKKPNAWGFHDMLGNVWEWCSDQQVGGTGGGPGASSADQPFVVRGGGYHDDSQTCGIHARITRAGLVPFRLDGLRLGCVAK